MNKTKLFAAAALLLAAAPSFAFNEEPLAKHDLKIVSEHRDHFSRNYMQLDSNFGMVGPGLLLTSLEYHTWAKDSYDTKEKEWFHDVDSLIAPGFMYLVPVTPKLLVGPGAKYQFNDNRASWIKAGFAGMYNHGNGFYAMAMYRFDRNLESSISEEGYDFADMDRKDLLLGYKTADWDVNLRMSHFHFTKSSSRADLALAGHKGEFAEAELITEYKGFNNFSPFASLIWESTDEYANPTAGGNNGFSVGLKLHF